MLVLQGWVRFNFLPFPKPASVFLAQGLGEKEAKGLAWRLDSDLNLVAENKKLYGLCQFAHQCVVARGIAEMNVADHSLEQKTQPSVAWHVVSRPAGSLLLRVAGSHICLVGELHRCGWRVAKRLKPMAWCGAKHLKSLEVLSPNMYHLPPYYGFCTGSAPQQGSRLRLSLL